jgi:hypothetical protein
MRNLVPPTLLVAALAAGLVAGPAVAQREGYTFLSYAGSDATLSSRGAEDEAARVNMPILPGDRLTTGAASRAEAVLASGNVVRVDVKSDVRFERMARTYEADDDRDLLVLERGAVAVEVRDAEPRDLAFRLDTGDATIVASGRAVFRVDSGRRGTEAYVVAGEIELLGQAGSVLLRTGEYAFVSGGDEIEVETSDLPRDRFTRFLEDRKTRNEIVPTQSNVAADYEYEADVASFDDYGSWVYVSSLGRNCWHPTVASDWRPYSYGTWRWTPGGLTWVSYEPWGWLPYHYGTWTFDASFGWCWLPGTAYSPAWVYWSYSPGYIGWCPVGYYGYYDNYYRSTRLWWGGDAGGVHTPHLRGRVDVTQIDPRGWNYVAAGRLGSRLDPSRDIVRGERVPFRPGETAFIATNPLRIDRTAGSAPQAVQQAVRRLTTEAASPRARASAPSEGLAAVLRRDVRLSPAAEQELRRTTGLRTQGEAFRPVTPDRLVTTTRTDEAPVRSGVRSGTPYVARDDGWRSPSSPAPRVVEPRTPERTTRDDSGWRAPRRPDRDRTGDATARSRDVWREAPSSRNTPRRESPSLQRERVVPREAPATRDAPSHRYAPSSPSRPSAPHAAPPSAPPPQRAAPAPAPQALPAGPRGERQRS